MQSVLRRPTKCIAYTGLLLCCPAMASAAPLVPPPVVAMIAHSVTRLPMMSLPLDDRGAAKPAAPDGGVTLNGSRGQLDTNQQWKLWLAAAPTPDTTATPPAQRENASASREAGNVQGVDRNEIRFGMASAFTGAAKESGENMKIGVEAAFAQVNEAGGIYGRRLRLITADDGYEPDRTIPAMRSLDEQGKVFGYIGNFGTATAMVAAPYALDRKMVFFGAFSGSKILRRDPPDRYVFNFRPGYADETEATVKYLVRTRRLQPSQIAVFAQDDGFGDAGIEGVNKGLRDLRGEQAPQPLVMKYKRNTIDLAAALRQFAARRRTIKAVVMVATYRAAAHFIEKTRDLAPGLVYTDVSGVGSTSLADELMLLGADYARGVVVTQVVPSIDSYATAILDYKTVLARYAPASKPDYVSMEGFIDARLLMDGLRRAGADLDTERLVNALEQITNSDMGIGTTLSFGASRHQASMKVWGTMLNEKGRYDPIELE